MFWIALPAMILAAPQTTNCQTIGTQTHCQTQQSQSVQPLDYGRALDEGARSVPNYADEQRRNQALEIQRQRADAEARASGLPTPLSQRAGKLVSAGDCPGAISVALKGGDLELASRIKAYCAD